MNGTEIVKLAADLATGAITADFIKSTYGDGILTSVLAIGTGSIAGLFANTAELSEAVAICAGAEI